MTLSVHSSTKGNSLYTQDKSTRPFSYLVKTILLVITFFILANFIWQYNYQEQLKVLKQGAKRNVALYSSKVEHELTQVQQSLLPLLANQTYIQQYLAYPNNEKSKQAQTYLQQLQATLPRSIIFIGNSKNILLPHSGKDLLSDSMMIDSVKEHISSRAFKGKYTAQFIFAKDKSLAKYLLALPIVNSLQHNKEQQIVGYIGLLMDLSSLQNEISNSLPNEEEVVLVSDQRGIIILSSQEPWLYQTFTNLPYQVKKQIDPDFNEKQLFSQLGITNIDNDILTTRSNASHTSKESFLVHSMPFNDHALRIHHLTNITPVIQRSNFIVAFASICLLMLLLFWLFFKEKRQAQLAEKTHDRKLLNLEIEFKQQQKLASMGMMATNIAHEINQPITAIKTEAKVGNKWLDKENSQEASKSFQAILQYTELLSAITSQLKDFARKRNSSGYNVANVNQALNHSRTLYNSRLIEENVDLVIDDFDKALNVRIDQHQLQQVFNNLLQNACDAMITMEHKQINLRITLDGPMVNILFNDNGPGIPLSLQNNIFDPFVSSKESTSSMGLGLAICHDIITRVGGCIELITKPDDKQVHSYTGACFKINLVRIVAEM